MSKKIITDEKAVETVLTRGVENVYPERETLKKLLMSGKQITLYCGYDPNSPTLHIGHGVTIHKLAQFQKLGHKVIFLFGDFTGQIGDPDKLSVRQQINHEQVLENLKGWKEQIKNLIDLDQVDFKFNSHWLAKLTFKDLIGIAQHFTVQQMLDRDMFQKRMSDNRPIYLHEFFYPLMQAYDSVAMDVDLEVGGNDQTFNMLCGRTLMKVMGKKEKCVLTTKLLVDPTGKKMGKSEGNMVTMIDKPEDIYGKVMSWSDEIMPSAFEILTDVPMVEFQEMLDKVKSGAIHPRNAKMKLAYEVVKTYCKEEAANKAQDNFVRVFQEHEKPNEIAIVKIAEEKVVAGKIGVLDLFVSTGLAKSNGEVRRLIAEKGIKIEDVVVTDEKMQVEIGSGVLLQRGKKQFLKAVK
ncbi:MAG: tyrosine--tRNA ligase [bacterium]